MARRVPQTSPGRDLLDYDQALRLALDEALGLGAALRRVAGEHEPVEAPEAAVALPPLLLPKALCARLLGGRLSPATFVPRFDAWLTRTHPAPAAAALVLYAAAAHLGFPTLGPAGERRILEAVEKYRKHYRIADPELPSRLAGTAGPWSPVSLWLEAVAVLTDRVAEVTAAPDQLRAALDSALERQRELEQQNETLATRVADLQHRAERLHREKQTLRTELTRLRRAADEHAAAAARAAELEARIERLRHELEELRAQRDEDTFAFEADDYLGGGPPAVARSAVALHNQRAGAPDLSGVYLVLLHSNDKDNTPMEVRDNLKLRGVRHVDVQRIDEGRIPTSFPQGAIVAIDVSFMSHPVADRAYANAVAAGVPVFKFARLGPARLYRRLVKFLQERERREMN